VSGAIALFAIPVTSCQNDVISGPIALLASAIRPCASLSVAVHLLHVLS
jgi:hypothetical protein